MVTTPPVGSDWVLQLFWLFTLALLLGLAVFLDDLRVLRVEDMPNRRLPHATTRLALDARY